MEKVSVDVATKEVTEWLDAKKVPQSKREDADFEKFIRTLVDAVRDGILVLQNDKTWKHILSFPLLGEDGSEYRTELTYKLRINEIDKNKHRKSVNKDDGALLLTLLALTNESKNVINLLDSGTDRSLADTIALFFL